MPSGGSRSSVEQQKFLIQIQDRLSWIIDTHSLDVPMTMAKYVPTVIRGYERGEHQLVRPPASRELNSGRRESVFRMIRLSATYPIETVVWLDALGNRAGGFNRSHTVLLLLLDWFGINPFPAVCTFGRRDWTISDDVPANTSSENRAKLSFTCQSRMLGVLRRAAGDVPEQQYLRSVLTSYAVGKARIDRPTKKKFDVLAKGTSSRQYESESIGFYCHPDLLDWIDALGNRAAGFNRSHVILYLLLDWLRINPFDDELLGSAKRSRT